MNIGQRALQVLKTVAPTLATAVGGPFGALAATAISAALGTSAEGSKAADTALLAATPEALLALRKAEQDFALRMKELGISEDQLLYQDIASARAREIAVRDNTPKVLAYLVTLGFFGTLAFLLIHGKPETGGDALLVMLGSLGTAWAGIMTYYYGSSVGSKNKDEALSKIAQAS
jgi:hypothetical protein